MSYVSGDDTREQVRQATDIVDLIGAHYELRRQGRIYVCRCPWHDDSRPSLQVNPDRQSWKCWVCNIGGDVFSFVMKRENVGFREALQLLADRAGIQLTPQKQQAPVEPGSADDKATLYQAAAWAEKQFHDFLLQDPQAETARRYFDERGISDESIHRFKLGYAPDEWNWLLDRAQNTPYSPAVLEAIGLAGVNQRGQRYDRFKGRVIFPIHDLQNRAIAFGGRVLPGAPPDAAKYINSPETRLFTKSDNLYALELARDIVGKTRKIIVVEGYTDVVLSHQSGLTEAVAVLGTALNERHIKLLRRFADTVYLVLDGDEAGKKRTNEVLGLFVAEQMDLRIMTLPEEYDPAEFMLERSAQEFRELLVGAVDALEHKIRVSTHGVDLKRDTHRANQSLEEILATIARAPRSASITDAASRLREQQILTRLARAFSLPESGLRDRLNELRSNQRRSAVERSTGQEKEGAAPEVDTTPPTKREAELLELFSAHPEVIPGALDYIGAAHFTTGGAREIFEIYRRLHEAGEPLDFHHVLGLLEHPHYKSLLVELDDRAHAKAAVVMETAAERLQQIIRNFHSDDERIERSEKVATLEAKSLPVDEEKELLLHLLEIEKLKHL